MSATSTTPPEVIAPGAAGQVSMRRLVWREFRHHPAAIIALTVLALICLGAIFAFLSPYDPNAIDLKNRFAPPSLAHPFGTDKQGRDLLTRLLYGGRVSLTVGFVAAATAILIGSVVGAAAGYFGGKLDSVLMRVTDFVLTFPQIFLLLFLAALLKESHIQFLGGGLGNIIIVIALTSWMVVARLVRANYLSLRESEYVQAARSYGASPLRVITMHIGPATMAVVLVAATRGVADAILTESGLSFLGYGIQPPAASWGTILQDAFSTIGVHPWLTVFPGMFIVVTVLCLNYLGDALRDALDPKRLVNR